MHSVNSVLNSNSYMGIAQSEKAYCILSTSGRNTVNAELKQLGFRHYYQFRDSKRDIVSGAADAVVRRCLHCDNKTDDDVVKKPQFESFPDLHEFPIQSEVC